MDRLAAQFQFILLPLLSISLLFLPNLQATAFKYCDNKGNYVVKVDGVDISPNPVVRGQRELLLVITGGKAVINVSYFGFHIHQETHDLCEEHPALLQLATLYSLTINFYLDLLHQVLTTLR